MRLPHSILSINHSPGFISRRNNDLKGNIEAPIDMRIFDLHSTLQPS